jgi:putative transcriptional regulator
MSESPYLANQLLIAMPGLDDPNFARSVTLLCQHNAEGALGIVVNRRADLTVGELLEQMQISTERLDLAQMPVYQGGPVQTDRGFVLHEPAGDYHSSLQVSESIHLTTSRDVLEAMAIGQGPRKVLVALGYAGWGEGQLEQEMLANSWLNVAAQAQILFQTPMDERWAQAVALTGIDLMRLSPFAGHA